MKTDSKQDAVTSNLAFRWGYIILPLIIFLLSLVIVAYFYRLLPAEVAYRFRADGSPNSWLPRGTILLWMILPQLLLIMLAAGSTGGITRLAAGFWPADSTWAMPQKILKLIGNMLALPQVILFFAMLDIFSYNSYQIHLLPLWVSAVIVMGLGGIVLGIFFVRAIRQTGV